MQSKIITIRLSYPLWEKMVAQVEQDNTTIADWVRQAIGDTLHDKDEDLRIEQVEARLEQRMGDLEARLLKEIQSLVSE